MNHEKAIKIDVDKQRIAKKYGGKYPDIIATMYKSGTHPNEIADIFNMSEGGIYYQLYKLIGKVRSRGLYRLSEKKVCDVFNEKGYNADIAKKYNIHKSTVSNIKNSIHTYRWILEKHGLIKNQKEVPMKDLPLCLKCDRKFDPGKNDFRLCKICREVNSRTSEEGMYTPRLNGWR